MSSFLGGFEVFVVETMKEIKRTIETKQGKNIFFILLMRKQNFISLRAFIPRYFKIHTMSSQRPKL